MMLTPREKELLLYINDYIARRGFSPSYDEMKDAIGLKSKSYIKHRVVELEKSGFIRRLARRARAIEVLRLPNQKRPRRPLYIPVHYCPECRRQMFPASPDKPICPEHRRIISPVPLEAVA